MSWRHSMTSHDVIFTVGDTDDVIKSDVIDLWRHRCRPLPGYGTKFYPSTDRVKTSLKQMRNVLVLLKQFERINSHELRGVVFSGSSLHSSNNVSNVWCIFPQEHIYSSSMVCGTDLSSGDRTHRSPQTVCRSGIWTSVSSSPIIIIIIIRRIYCHQHAKVHHLKYCVPIKNV